MTNPLLAPMSHAVGAILAKIRREATPLAKADSQRLGDKAVFVDGVFLEDEGLVGAAKAGRVIVRGTEYTTRSARRERRFKAKQARSVL